MSIHGHHFVCDHPAPLSISTIVKRLKGASATSIRRFPSLQKSLWMRSFWSSGYYATSCGGASLDVIKAYIDNQDQNSSQD